MEDGTGDIFINSGGAILKRDSFKIEDGQYVNHWKVDEKQEHIIKLSYEGIECDSIKVNIIASTVESIEFFNDTSNDAHLELMENYDGTWFEDENNNNKFYWYHVGWNVCNEGNKIKIKEKGRDFNPETDIYTYQYKDDYYEDLIKGEEIDSEGFMNQNGDILNEEYLSIADNQYIEKWTPEKEYKITLSYMGASDEISITIKENLVDSISVDIEDNVSVIEKTNCILEKYYFIEDVAIPYINSITVTYKDKSSTTYKKHELPDNEYEFINESDDNDKLNNDYLECDTKVDQFDELMHFGENDAYISYLDKRFDIKVNLIKESDASSSGGDIGTGISSEDDNSSVGVGGGYYGGGFIPSITTEEELELKPEARMDGDNIIVFVEIEAKTDSLGRAQVAITEQVFKDSLKVALEEVKKVQALGKDNVKAILKFKIKTGSHVNEVAIIVSPRAVKEVAIEEKLNVKVSTILGDINFDNEALKEIEKNAGLNEIKVKLTKTDTAKMPVEKKSVVETIANGRPMLDLEVTTEGNNIGNFGEGEVTISVPYIMKDGEKSENLTVYFVDDKGETEEMATSFDAKTNKTIFTTSHFSTYVVGYVEGKVVRNLDIKLTSKVTLKGKIKLTWLGVDSSKVDGFEVFRSTKRFSGFTTKAFYKTSNSNKKNYINTKDLKKRNRYYYKLRAYKVVDGKIIYSDWSTKAYRKLK